MDIKNETANWIKIAFINLLIVAVLGVLMRYKIAFYLPFVEQKHLLHAHSHFAFTGWITQALMILLIHWLSGQKADFSFRKYKWLLIANAAVAYGMLLSFPVQGYGVISITFSTFSIVVSYVFAVVYWRDLNTLTQSLSRYWFKAALLFSVVSSAGTFALSAMMATKTIHQNWYLAAIYFYLHFQYNGWFFFACMGLFYSLIEYVLPAGKLKTVFWLFALACVPAYILSALWLPLPEWVHTIVSIAAVAQIVAWIILLAAIFKKQQLPVLITGHVKWILTLVALAASVKLLLQVGSTIHFLSNLAFSFRPIVIGYLHLVLLGVITLFIVAYSLAKEIIPPGSKIKTGVIVFIVGILLNEFLLMLQGIGAIAYIRIPFINELLLCAALIMFSGVLWLNIGFIKSKLDK